MGELTSVPILALMRCHPAKILACCHEVDCFQVNGRESSKFNIHIVRREETA
jgi:hypothetical protein